MLRWILAGLAIGAAITLKTCRKWGKCVAETVESEPDFQTKVSTPPKQDSDSFKRLTGLNQRQINNLSKAGYSDMAVLKKASDEELLAVSGIGPAALKKIRSI